MDWIEECDDACPKCGETNWFFDGLDDNNCYICPDCGYRWNDEGEEQEIGNGCE